MVFRTGGNIPHRRPPDGDLAHFSRFEGVYLIQICDARGFDCNKVAIYILFEANSGEVQSGVMRERDLASERSIHIH